MRIKLLPVAVLTGLWIVASSGVDAGVAQRARRVQLLEIEPAAPVADQLPPLIRQSLATNPAEPIPVGKFGPFGVGAREDTAPVAPAAEPAYPLLDLKTDPDPGDVTAPANTAP